MASQTEALPATPEQIEGPYWCPGSPERTNLREPGVIGERLTLTGVVRDRYGSPVAGAWLDFWQADGDGAYDNDGYRLRGHQFTAADGRYRLKTVIPAEYSDEIERDGQVYQVHRTAHLHLKVKRPRRPTLTTQFYFPDEPQNEHDGLYRPECLLDLVSGPDGKQAKYDIVLG